MGTGMVEATEVSFVANVTDNHRKNRFEMIPTGNLADANGDDLRLNCHSIIRDSKSGDLILSFYDDEDNKVYNALTKWTDAKPITFDIIGYNSKHEIARKISVTADPGYVTWNTYIDFSWNDSGLAPAIEMVIRRYDRTQTRF